MAKGLYFVFSWTGIAWICSSLRYFAYIFFAGSFALALSRAMWYSDAICFLMSFGCCIFLSPGALPGGALEMVSFSFLVGDVLFQAAKALSKAYLCVVVLNVTSARDSNCLAPVLGLRMLIAPAFSPLVCMAMIF